MVRFATEMRSPESRPGHRPGRTFEEELNLRYLSPGAFTVLGPEDRGLPPEPPQAPPVYRLSPNSRRHRNQAFSIIAEPLSGRSRSPSPTSGRVSPFRGRGFNPTGSRHTSPAPSPPPIDKINNNQYPINIVNRPTNVKKSQIPQLKRRDIIFTEEDDDSPKYQRKNGTNLKPQLSKSLNNIGPKKPPIIPARRHPGIIAKGVNGGGFSRLSPIIGSSPEPSSDTKSQPSPGSRIPKSRSTPPSRKHSPNREFSPDYNGNGNTSTYLDHRGKPRQREPDLIDYQGKVNFEGDASSSREGSPEYYKRGAAGASREGSPEYHKRKSKRDGSPEYYRKGKAGTSREGSPEYQRREKGSGSREQSPSRRKYSDSREHSPVRGSKHSPTRSKRVSSSREHSPERSPSKNKHFSLREHSPSRRDHSPSRKKYPNSREHSPLRNKNEHSPTRRKHSSRDNSPARSKYASSSREHSPVRYRKHDYSPTRSRYGSPSRKSRPSSPSKDRNVSSPSRNRSSPIKDRYTSNKRRSSPSRDRFASPPLKNRETSSSPAPSSPEYKKSSSRDQSPENRDSSRPSSVNRNLKSPEHENRRRKMDKNSNVRGRVNTSSRHQSPLDNLKSPVHSRGTSRNPSPSSSKPPFSPTRIPIRNYKNIQSKVNSYAKTTTTANNASKSTTNKTVPNNGSNVKRTESVKNVSKPPPKTQTQSGKMAKTGGSNTNLNKAGVKNTSQSNLNKTTTARTNTNTTTTKKTSNTSVKSAGKVNKDIDPVKPSDNQKTKPAASKPKPSETLKKVESSAKLDPPAIPSSNPSAPAKANTEAKTETKEPAKPKETPMYMDEGRVLSATSVSSAIERMNDTVLDSQTLLKDHNISKLSPNPEHKLTTPNNNNNAVVSLANQNNPNNTAVPSVETNPINSQINNVSNSVSNENNVANNSINKLISPDDNFGAKVNNNSGFQSANDRIKEARTMVASDVKPIRITVQEKADGVEVQSGNVRFPANVTNGVAAGSGGGGAPQGENGNGNGNNPQPENSPPKSRCQLFMEKVKNKMPCSCCKPKEKKIEDAVGKEENEKKGCFPCCKKNKKKIEVEQVIVTRPDEMEEAKKTFMDRLKCCSKGNKVGDSTTGCCGRGRKKDSWEDRRDSILSVPTPVSKGTKCKNFLKMIFCCGCCACACCKKKTPAPKMLEETSASRRASMMSKKKSLTPTVLPPEEPKNKLDTSLVEYTSTMKAAIPVLPIALAYICLFFNIFAPGTGTVFSGLFCLCMGIPRFSQRDGPKPRLGAFIINIIIGCGQLFTVLFCLVGWGWSIWWGVIMVKIAKKYKKLKKIEERLEAQEKAAAEAEALQKKKDAEKGRA